MATYKRPKRKVAGGWDNEYPSLGWSSIGGLGYNKNMVCFSCRYVKRTSLHPSNEENIICPHCRKPLISMWCKVKLPKKTDIKAWKKLEKGHTI
jgi:hypothetical protein